MRHDCGGEELHAAHDLHMRDHSADVEPADYATDIEFIAHAPQPLDAGLRRVENRHRLAGLFVGSAAEALDPLWESYGLRLRSRGAVDGGHGLQVMIDARFHHLPDLRAFLTDVQRQN